MQESASWVTRVGAPSRVLTIKTASKKKIHAYFMNEAPNRQRCYSVPWSWIKWSNLTTFTVDQYSTLAIWKSFSWMGGSSLCWILLFTNIADPPFVSLTDDPHDKFYIQTQNNLNFVKVLFLWPAICQFVLFWGKIQVHGIYCWYFDSSMCW